MIVFDNKKVLLRERKRHTARHVASAHYADLSRGGTPSQISGYPIPGPGGYPIPGLGRGTPSQVQGVPHPRSGGYPIPCLGGYPISGPGGTPSQVWGVPRVPPHHLDLAGVPPTSDLRWGTPLPNI